MSALATGGTAGSCNGSLSIDWLAWMSANPGAVGHPLHLGQTFYAQAWYRDALVAGTANPMRGLQFSVCP